MRRLVRGKWRDSKDLLMRSRKVCKRCDKHVFNLAEHMRDAHGVGGPRRQRSFRPGVCTVCNKSCRDIKSHQRFAHAPKNLACTECDYKCVSPHMLRRHTQYRHNSGEKKHACQHCGYTAVEKTALRLHLACAHDVGPWECAICYRRGISSTQLGTHAVCRRCYLKATGKNSRVEKVWSEYIERELTSNGLLSADTALCSVGGCSRLRPDLLYTSRELVVVCECDEHQHMYNSGTYQCEERRLADIVCELVKSFPGTPICVIRWNPHACKHTRMRRAQRLEVMVALKRVLRATPPAAPLSVFYSFYNRDNPHLIRSVPPQFVDSLEDVVTLSDALSNTPRLVPV